jgi:hypothetical protein
MDICREAAANVRPMADIETAIDEAVAILSCRQHLLARQSSIYKRRKKGPPRSAYLDRNQVIAETVSYLTRRGFAATRNRGTRGKECACSIVVKALGRLGLAMTEAAVERIWQKAPPDLNPVNRPSDK